MNSTQSSDQTTSLPFLGKGPLLPSFVALLVHPCGITSVTFTIMGGPRNPDHFQLPPAKEADRLGEYVKSRCCATLSIKCGCARAPPCFVLRMAIDCTEVLMFSLNPSKNLRSRFSEHSSGVPVAVKPYSCAIHEPDVLCCALETSELFAYCNLNSSEYCE